MTKTLAASCVGGVVTVDGFPLPGAVVGGEGVAQSSGVALLDEDAAYYLPKTSGDLKSTLTTMIDVLTQVKAGLDKTVEALGKASSALTQHDTAGFLIAATAGVPSPPIATSNITGITTASSAITSAATQIETLKGQLNTLKGALA